ncbi:MAG: hypothetical protein QGI88_14265 [SAR202 cluster bacterium]|nr:hypothetical protein [SAR202 cluster bacterium]
MKSLKLLSVMFVFAVFLAGGPVVYGGLSWSGMDPIIGLPDGRIVNVDFSVPPGTWCKIDGPIDVKIRAPHGSKLIEEQVGLCGVPTDTVMTYSRDDTFSVQARFGTVNRSENFPFQVMISVDGEEQATCAGQAKRGVSCTVELDDDLADSNSNAQGHRKR